MQSKKFIDATVSPKFNWAAFKEKASEKIRKAEEKVAAIKSEVASEKGMVAVANGKMKGFQNNLAKALKAKGKFKNATVSNKASAEDKEGRRNVLNNLITTAGTTLTGIFKKPDTYVTNNTTNTTTAAPSGSEKEKDNTMLYVGLGGGALVLVILLVVMLKK